MKHLGNVCNIDGKSVDPADVIIFGAPCQDLSVAGKRSGMKHKALGDNETTRSGLFFEAIRIIKEMRESTNGEYPKYAVYENVPGAFSSNKGRDFHAVLEALCSVCDDTVSIPEPYDSKRTKLVWNKAGEIVGDNYSVAWRTLDAQHFGVPQRRRRIALVADFGGQSAPEILFERNGVSGDIAESGAEGQGVAGDVEKGVGTTEYMTGWDNQEKRIFSDRGVSPTLSGSDGGGGRTGCGYVMPTVKGAPSGTAQVHAVFSFDSLSSNSMKSPNPHSGCRQVEIAKCIDTTNPDPSKNQGGMAVVHDARGNGDGSIAPTMTGDHQNRVTDYTGIAAFQNTGHGWWNESDIGATVRTPCGGDSTKANLVAAVDCRNGTENPDINGTLQAKPNGGTSYNLQNTVRTHQSVRRLTPLECERLQGFPDSWTDIPPQTEVTAEDLAFWRVVWDEWQAMNGAKPKTDKQIIKWLQSEPADSARYKALGNSIALPPWRFVLSRIHNHGARTMASLFDGIGGFPKIWQELGGQTLWASEVEPFCVKVTSRRFEGGVNGGMESN